MHVRNYVRKTRNFGARNRTFNGMVHASDSGLTGWRRSKQLQGPAGDHWNEALLERYTSKVSRCLLLFFLLLSLLLYYIHVDAISLSFFLTVDEKVFEESREAHLSGDFKMIEGFIRDPSHYYESFEDRLNRSDGTVVTRVGENIIRALEVVFGVGPFDHSRQVPSHHREAKRDSQRSRVICVSVQHHRRPHRDQQHCRQAPGSRRGDTSEA